MINVEKAYAYCKEDISLIENYEAAVSDTTHVWICHHRDGVKTLPSGIKVYRSREDLKADNRYYHCPANELIFLTKEEHKRMHFNSIRNKLIKSRIGMPRSEQCKKELSIRMQGLHKGQHWKVVNGKRVWYDN